jgi:hypothetical protein
MMSVLVRRVVDGWLDCLSSLLYSRRLVFGFCQQTVGCYGVTRLFHALRKKELKPTI